MSSHDNEHMATDEKLPEEPGDWFRGSGATAAAALAAGRQRTGMSGTQLLAAIRAGDPDCKQQTGGKR